MKNLIKAQFKREYLLAMRNKNEILNPLLFFILVIAFFPLALDNHFKTLQLFAPEIVWVVTILTILISLPRLFRDDYLEGVLEQFIFQRDQLTMVLYVKLISHWLLHILPIICIMPILVLFLAISYKTLVFLELSLVLATPTLISLGAIGAALTVGLRNQSILLTLIILPLYIPVLIFAANLVPLAIAGISINGIAALLLSMTIVSVLFAPWCCRFALLNR